LLIESRPDQQVDSPPTRRVSGTRPLLSLRAGRGAFSSVADYLAAHYFPSLLFDSCQRWQCSPE
jgi:hypothetical protein